MVVLELCMTGLWKSFVHQIESQLNMYTRAFALSRFFFLSAVSSPVHTAPHHVHRNRCACFFRCVQIGSMVHHHINNRNRMDEGIQSWNAWTAIWIIPSMKWPQPLALEGFLHKKPINAFSRFPDEMCTRSQAQTKRNEKKNRIKIVALWMWTSNRAELRRVPALQQHNNTPTQQSVGLAGHA